LLAQKLRRFPVPLICEVRRHWDEIEIEIEIGQSVQEKWRRDFSIGSIDPR
jgi:hypothetical protein